MDLLIDNAVTRAVSNILEAAFLSKLELKALLLGSSIKLPIIIAFFLLVVRPLSESFVKNLATVGFFFPALVAGFLWGSFAISSTDEFLFCSEINTGLQDFGISLKLGLNGISMPLYLMASIVGLAAGLYAVNSGAERLSIYLALLLLMLGGTLGAFASIDLFFFYFFHEIALIPTFVMIGIWGGRGRRSAAMELTIYLTLGALVSLLGLLSVYFQSGLHSFDIVTLKEHLGELGFSVAAQKYMFALLLFGFGILVSLWPFHSWAPRGYTAAPSSVAMLHAGALKKFGLYGLIQIGAPLLPHGASQWTGLIVWLALGNLIFIGFVTIAERDLKQMIGYSSVMHMGYAFLGIACLSSVGIGGAVMMMFAHGLSVALLFLLSTCVYHRTQTFDMFEMGGLGRQAPLLAGFFVAAIMATVGLPGFANFWGEIAIFVGLWEYRPWLLVPAVAGIVMSAIYGLRAVARIFFGEPSEEFKKVAAESTVEDLHMNERIPAILLLLALVVVGFWPKSISQPLNKAVNAVYPLPIETAEIVPSHSSHSADIASSLSTRLEGFNVVSDN